MRKTSETASAELEELVAIKRLLVLGLLKLGATQNEVAAAMGVTQGTVSKMFPGGLAKSSKPASGQ